MPEQPPTIESPAKGRPESAYESAPTDGLRRRVGTGLAYLAVLPLVYCGGAVAENSKRYYAATSEGDYPELSTDVSQTAAEYIGGPLAIKCEDTDLRVAHSMGYVTTYGVESVNLMWPSSIIHLDLEQCHAINSITDDTLYYDNLLALFVIDHERQHTQGVRDEAAATCYALQNVALQLQARGYDTSSLALFKQDFAQLTRQDMTAEYRSDECRPGGGLDVRPDMSRDNIWLPAADAQL